MSAPRDYSPPDVTARDAVANLCQTFRALGDAEEGTELQIPTSHFAEWASRLERAVARMDQEKASQL